MDKKSVLLSLWQKFVNRFYKSGECEGLMEDVLKPSVSYYEEPKERKGLKERDSLSRTEAAVPQQLRLPDGTGQHLSANSL